jgi:hypothetical protein
MPTTSINDDCAPPGGILAAYLTDTLTLAVSAGGSVVYAGYLPWEEDEVDLCREGFTDLKGAAAVAGVAKWGDCVALVGVGGDVRISRGGDDKWHTIMNGTRQVSAGHHVSNDQYILFRQREDCLVPTPDSFPTDTFFSATGGLPRFLLLTVFRVSTQHAVMLTCHGELYAIGALEHGQLGVPLR